MGNGQSNLVTSENFDKPMISMLDIKTNIENLNKTVDAYKDSSASTIIQAVADYNKANVRKEAQITLPLDVINKIKTFHSTILQKINSTDPNHKFDPNSDIAAYFKQDQQKLEQNIQKTSLYKNPAGLDKVLNSINNMKTKYKLFEYKYIKLNMFMLAFLPQIHKTMLKFTSEVITIVEAREKYRQKLFENHIAQFFKLLNDDPSLPPLPRMDELAAKLTTEVEEDNRKYLENFRKQFDDKTGKISVSKMFQQMYSSASPEEQGIVKTIIASMNAAPSAAAAAAGTAPRVPVPRVPTSEMASAAAPAAAAPRSNNRGVSGLRGPVTRKEAQASAARIAVERARAAEVALNRQQPGALRVSRLVKSGGKKNKTKKGGFIRGHTSVPLSQKGGFIRDGTSIPQSFYEL